MRWSHSVFVDGACWVCFLLPVFIRRGANPEHILSVLSDDRRREAPSLLGRSGGTPPPPGKFFIKNKKKQNGAFLALNCTVSNMKFHVQNFFKNPLIAYTGDMLKRTMHGYASTYESKNCCSRCLVVFTAQVAGCLLPSPSCSFTNFRLKHRGLPRPAIFFWRKAAEQIR